METKVGKTGVVKTKGREKERRRKEARGEEENKKKKNNGSKEGSREVENLG